ncbi:MAG: glycosyltransferase family 4 protein, partial [Planctomycetota bacterium]
FVFPTIEEGSALVTYEALASGLPVITTPNAGSVIRDGKDGFIIPIRNTEMLAEKIEYFYKNRDAVKEMGKSASERALEFKWEKYSKQLVKEYEKVLGG